MSLNTQSSWFQIFVAEVAHFSVAYSILFTVLVKWPELGIGVALIGVTLAGIKEFWYDANYEQPKQDFLANLLDFSCYLGGILLAFIVN
jgi:hypothetical protein